MQYYLNRIFRLCRKINKHCKPDVAFCAYSKFCSVSIWSDGIDAGHNESILLDGKYTCFFYANRDDMRDLYQRLKQIYKGDKR